MKCKNISNKINNFVVQNLKKFKLNGQTSSKMPAMPKDKTTAAITVVDNNIKYNNNNNNSNNNNNNCNNSKDNKLEENNLNNSANIENNSCNINKETTNKINNSIANGSSINNSSANNTAGSNGGGGGGSGGEGGTDISIKKRGVNDFRFGKAIGEGSFSTVYIAKDIHTNKEYAIKVCDKQHIFRENKNKYILIEREAMNTLSNAPGFVTLFCTFQCTKSLYFAMTYAKNGDLLPFINKVGSFDLECTKFYAAELVLALEEMHSRGIIHRDLKPENILLDDSMHVLITDFGSAKILPKDTTSKTNSNMDNSNTTNNSNSNENSANDNTTRARKYSFVGTAQYVSPELLKGEQSTISSDLWALGCIIYQMISGLPPFRSNIEYQIFQKIQKLDLTFPEGFDEVAKDLVTKLLVIDPKSRIGANDSNFRYTSIRDHKFFDNIEWDTLREQKPPQIYPYLPGDDLHSDYCVPDHLEPGLDDKQIQRLLDLELGTSNCCGDKQQKIVSNKKNIADLTETEKESRLRQQTNEKYNCFCKGEVILKQGIVNKRKGLFARKRMLLLTSGPRLIYVDPVSMVKKGEIPWSPVLRVEPKNFKIFFIHTPNRTYYLEEPEGYALNWCRDIEDVRIFTYGNKNNS